MGGGTGHDDDETDVYLAKLSEQADRFEDMVDYMKKVIAEKKGCLAMEERNIVSVAFKNVIGQRRSSLRVIRNAEEKEAAEKGSTKLAMVRAYRVKLQEELQTLCASVISLLDGSLIKMADSHEARVFYQKMKADYFRYRSETAEGDDKDTFKTAAKEAYEEAMVNAQNLETTHPIRLGLCLNQTVFMFEEEKLCEEACVAAKAAFDAAIGDLDGLDEDTYKDATLIMQLLRENLNLWTTEMLEKQEQAAMAKEGKKKKKKEAQ